MLDFSTVAAVDPEIAQVLDRELVRQQSHIELIASENFVSPAVLGAMGTHLTNKYAEGYPGKRYYGGCEEVDVAENLARDRACALFGADHANVQPHSGAQANMAVYFALLNPGDTILGMNLAHGGHLTHGSPVNMSGKYFNIVPYGVSEDTEMIDYDAVREIALKARPKLIVAGASAYPRALDFKAFREIADEAGCPLMVDMAHIAGLVAAGEHQNPVPFSDIVTTTTHKTLRGPRGGMILCREEYAKAIDKAVFPGQQGGPLMHIIAAKAVCFKEAATESFKNYCGQVVKNAKALANAFTENGVRLVSGGTDNHLMLLNLTGTDVTGKALEKLLVQANITANKNAIPFDEKSPFITSGLRVGTPAITTRGMSEAEMPAIAEMVARIIREGESAIEPVREQALALLSAFPLYQ